MAPCCSTGLTSREEPHCAHNESRHVRKDCETAPGARRKRAGKSTHALRRVPGIRAEQRGNGKRAQTEHKRQMENAGRSDGLSKAKSRTHQELRVNGVGGAVRGELKEERARHRAAVAVLSRKKEAKVDEPGQD